VTGAPPRWMAALPALFALGAKMGGATPVGTGALVGADRAQALAATERDRQMALGQRQQQIDLQGQQMQAQQAAQQMAREQQMAQQREGAIKAAVDDLRMQKFTKKADYDQAVTFRENLIGQTFGPVRPNILRTLAPYNGPNVESAAREAVEALVKQHGVEIFAKPAMVQIDRDEDGVPENVPILEAASLGKFPIARDPQTGQPMTPPKEVKSDNVQPFDEAYKNTLAQWQAEGKDINSPRVKLAAQQAAAKLVAEQQAPIDPTVAAIRDLTLSNMRDRREQPAVDPRIATRVNSIASAFRADPIVKRTNTMAEAVTFVNSLDLNSKNPADDQALIYAFAKAQDPESVVREGEYATVQKYAQTWLQNFGFNAKRVLDNSEFLTTQARANMRATVLKRYAAARGMYDNVRASFTRQVNATSGGQVDPEDYLTDYAGAMPSPQTGKPEPRKPAAATTAPASGAIAVGSVQTLKSGKKVKVTKVNPDGTYEGTVVR
jgi:hypothetical protein